MVAYSDYPNKINGHAVETSNGHAVEKSNGHAVEKSNGHAVEEPEKRPRFRLLAAIAAPFKDVDERAIRRKGKHAKHSIIGAPFANHASSRARTKPFTNGGD